MSWGQFCFAGNRLAPSPGPVKHGQGRTKGDAKPKPIHRPQKLGVGDAWHKSGSLWGYSFKELQSPPESWGSEAHTGLGLTAGEETVTLHCSNYCI